MCIQGAANLIASKNILQYAAGILAVEAYHAGTIRTLLWQKVRTTGMRPLSRGACVSAMRLHSGAAWQRRQQPLRHTQ